MKLVVWDRPAEVGAWVCARLGTFFDEKTNTAIGQELDGELIGGVVYDNFRGGSICMHVAASRKDWLSREFLAAVFGYPFGQLGVNKVIAPIDSTNTHSTQFVERLGYRKEAVIAEAGEGGDLILMTMTRDQCRWFNGVSQNG